MNTKNDKAPVEAATSNRGKESVTKQDSAVDTTTFTRPDEPKVFHRVVRRLVYTDHYVILSLCGERIHCDGQPRRWTRQEALNQGVICTSCDYMHDLDTDLKETIQ